MDRPIQSIKNLPVLVIGLGASGKAACHLLRQQGAVVTAIDSADTVTLQRDAQELRQAGMAVYLGRSEAPIGPWELAVVSPGVPSQGPMVRPLLDNGVQVIGELELGCRYCACPKVAITGTNGKTTTTELVALLLTRAHIKTVAAGNIGLPLCAVVRQAQGWDYLTLEVSSFQLETIHEFHPVVAVLMNITPDHLDRYQSLADYRRAKAAVFKNQEPADWAIIQWEALQQLGGLPSLRPPQIITFSATHPQADFHLERGWIVSRNARCPGRLLNLAEVQLRGPHNVENLMAALAAGLVLNVPAEKAGAALKEYTPAPHRCELVAEIDGVKFVNDSKATNVDAVRQALLTMPRPGDGAPNVWLIAGGKDKGFEYGELGALLAERVKGAFLIGQTREKIGAAWHCFTPCTPVNSLLEAVTEAARRAKPGDVVLLSPACSSFDMFQNYQHRGEVFRQAVDRWQRMPRPGAGPVAVFE